MASLFCLLLLILCCNVYYGARTKQRSEGETLSKKHKNFCFGWCIKSMVPHCRFKPNRNYENCDGNLYAIPQIGQRKLRQHRLIRAFKEACLPLIQKWGNFRPVVRFYATAMKWRKSISSLPCPCVVVCSRIVSAP